MADYSSRRVQQQNLECLFSIGNPDRGGNFTCVGYAPSQRRRCRNPIAARNQEAAREIFDQLSRMNPLDVSDIQTGKLKEAAGYALCRRWHQDQADTVVQQWKKILRESVSRQPGWRRDGEGSEERTTSRDRSRLASHLNPVMASPLASRSTSSSTRSHSRSEESLQPINRHNVVNSGLSRFDMASPLASRSTSSSTRSHSRSEEPLRPVNRHNGVDGRLSRLEDELEDLRRMITRLGGTMHEPQRPEPSAPTAVEEEQQQSSVMIPELQQQSAVVPDSEPAHRQTCSATHKSRRSIDEDCVICTMPMVNCSLSELVWCKNSCGRSVHRDCFETMEGFAHATRCVFCRVNWANGCEHDEQPPEQFEMWADWELGLNSLFNQSS